MKRLIIAIDCDDVLIDSSDRIVERYNAKYGASIDASHMYRQDLDWGAGSHEAAIDRMNSLMLDDRILDDLVPSEATINAVRALASQHELHLVTGRQTYLEPSTRALLDAYFPGCFTSVEHTNYIASASSPEPRRSKGEVCAQIHANILIDDHVKHGKNVLNHGVREVLLFGDYPWNQTDDDTPGITRCHDWQEVLQNIETLSHEL